MSAAGIAYVPKRAHPPRPCAWCKGMIEAPLESNQRTHEGECRLKHNNAIKGAYRARKRRAA